MYKIPDHLLVLPFMRVMNANCVSGPLTWGFPAVTTFCGLTHLLSRKSGEETAFDGVGIISHSFEPQIHQTGYEKRFSQTRNPLESDGSTAGIIEEGRAHMTVSLVIGVYGEKPEENGLYDAVMVLRPAGGTVTGMKQPYIVSLDKFAESDRKSCRKIFRKLLPGFALTDRSDFLAEHHKNMQAENPEKTLLDALLDISALKHDFSETGEGKAEWKTFKEGRGWLVPIPAGFAGISPVYPAGEVKNTRDSETPFRFVEAVYTIGEWKNPLNLGGLDEFLWFYNSDEDNGIYACGHRKIYE